MADVPTDSINVDVCPHMYMVSPPRGIVLLESYNDFVLLKGASWEERYVLCL